MNAPSAVTRKAVELTTGSYSLLPLSLSPRHVQIAPHRELIRPILTAFLKKKHLKTDFRILRVQGLS